MPPTPSLGPHSSRLIYTLFALLHSSLNPYSSSGRTHVHSKRATTFNPHSPKDIVFACLIPVLVLLSGVFAGLTLGYMSLDQTQLNVLCLSGTPEQRKYAQKILPIRKNGHLLLVTLLLANMIVNETLPIISDPVLGGGVQSVVVSTVLIIIFSEIIPQSLFTRYGLYLGAKAAPFTQLLIYALGVISWPVAKLLEFVLGSHHGIIYRRAELKELIAMHSAQEHHGGDLKMDTVAIIGATLDLQEKIVRDAMTPIENVFMLSIDARLDYDLMKKIVASGHSRIPVFEEIDAPASVRVANSSVTKVKKILGILLVKQLVLIDPKEAPPIHTIPLNTVPFVYNNQTLLGILDKFQEGRSHIAIVSRYSVEKVQKVQKEVKRGLTQRLREKVGMGDDSDDEAEETEKKKDTQTTDVESGSSDDNEEGDVVIRDYGADPLSGVPVKPPSGSSWTGSSGLEQSMPADAALNIADMDQFFAGLDTSVMPVGIITLEDVLEELIGEEIFDEFDADGAKGTYVHHRKHLVPSHHGSPALGALAANERPPAVGTPTGGLRTLNFLRSRSVPPSQRDPGDGKSAEPQAQSKPALKDGRELEPEVHTAEVPKDAAPGPDMPLEAVLRAGMGRRGRVAAAGSSGPRGRFKSSPLDAGKGVETAGLAVEDPQESKPPEQS
ncbi:unnamed protein product [Mycena citricolor]|uniref:CNNM transmembrane domain-containing protein n=1 Tax=Mycena citricolor TaxID=2018698 RepID=A0AAD2GY83_9AGAR|nr:unnamed protein product [Mycena citricolor]